MSERRQKSGTEVTDMSTLTVRQAALKLKCTLKYVYDLVYAGKLEASKTGRQWRISTPSVTAYASGREKKNASRSGAQ
jgi:excisionase family DNA binding protein